MNRRPKSAEAYARWLYPRELQDGIRERIANSIHVQNVRVNAFMDGVRWARRQEAAKRRAGNKEGSRDAI